MKINDKRKQTIKNPTYHDLIQGRVYQDISGNIVMKCEDDLLVAIEKGLVIIQNEEYSQVDTFTELNVTLEIL